MWLTHLIIVEVMRANHHIEHNEHYAQCHECYAPQLLPFQAWWVQATRYGFFLGQEVGIVQGPWDHIGDERHGGGAKNCYDNFQALREETQCRIGDEEEEAQDDSVFLSHVHVWHPVLLMLMMLGSLVNETFLGENVRLLHVTCD